MGDMDLGPIERRLQGEQYADNLEHLALVDVPALLAEVRRVRGERDGARRAIIGAARQAGGTLTLTAATVRDLPSPTPAPSMDEAEDGALAFRA